METKKTNENLVNNNNQPQQQLPFDVLLNEEFGEFQKNGFSRNWFVPIVKNQIEMDKLISIREEKHPQYSMGWDFPNTLLEVKKDENGNLTSIYVLYSKGGKLYKVVSQKDYGVIKSRMVLKNKKYVPYEKCDLVLFNGKIDERDGDRLIKSTNYKNGIKDGECFSYYKRKRFDSLINSTGLPFYEKITYKNGKKNGEYENNKYGIEGNYIDNKKNGVWNVTEEDILRDVILSYQEKYDLKHYECKNFTETHFKTLGCRYNNNSIWEVFYVNDVLHGKYKRGHYEGEFLLGLPNCVERYTFDNTVKNTRYVDGKINGISISYCLGDSHDRVESTVTLTSYEDGLNVRSVELSSNRNRGIPNKLTSQTQHYLTDDVFYSLNKNDMNIEDITLEDFQDNWVVMDVKEFEMKNDKYGEESKRCVNHISIENKELKYGFNYLDDYYVDECGYPYFEEKEFYFRNSKTILTSDEFKYSSDYQPRVFTFSTKGNPIQVLMNGELVDEKVGNDTNPIILKFQKEVLQSLSDKMKLSYEKELKEKELEKKNEKKRKQKEKEINGTSVNSFPMD